MVIIIIINKSCNEYPVSVFGRKNGDALTPEDAYSPETQ
jgi:hypothetical protein